MGGWRAKSKQGAARLCNRELHPRIPGAYTAKTGKLQGAMV
jgi:hypothetical protein